MTRLNRVLGATILMVTHDPYSASYASRVLFLKDGRLFNELLRGERDRPAFYHEILDVLALLGVTSVTLRDLSWRNARRQARDYLVYFVTIVIATALMYAFNGLVFSREIAELSAKLSSLPLVIVLASVAVVLILGWLVAYITRFMLTRRSRELGTYLLIGLEHRQVARLFFLENLAVGAVALVLGWCWET